MLTRIIAITCICMLAFSCNNSNEKDENDIPKIPIDTEVRTFIFGNSLVSHLEQVNITPSQETSVPHWMYLLSQSSGTTYAASGQFGFLQNHRNLPPDVNMVFDLFSSPWNNDTEEFGEADFNSVWITPANFTQFQSPDENYFDESFSPIEATIDVMEWVSEQEPGINLYIYEGWPDMSPFIESFPPTPEEMVEYHEYTVGDYHRWFIELQDGVQEQLPNLEVKMIPVGPILERILTETPLAELPITEIYEDDAPHGRATLYFLISMITYHVMFQTSAPDNYEIPEIINPSVGDNYQDIQSIITNELNSFTDTNGVSRVW